jgi:uncharacterized protein YhdP
MFKGFKGPSSGALLQYFGAASKVNTENFPFQYHFHCKNSPEGLQTLKTQSM